MAFSRGEHCVVLPGVSIGDGTRLGNFVLIRSGATIGQECVIGSNVDIEGDGVCIGNHVSLQSFVYVTCGVVIEDEVFCGPRVTTMNDRRMSYRRRSLTFVRQAPYYFNIILGSLGAAPLDLIGLGHIVNMLPERATWAVGGIGTHQLDANAMGIAAGGHVRVGLEDNLFYDRRRADLADNARLVARVARIARELGREPASGTEARKLIGLPSQRRRAA